MGSPWLSTHCLAKLFHQPQEKRHTDKKKKVDPWVNLSLGTEELRVSKHVTTTSHIMVVPRNNFGASIYAGWIFSLGSVFWIMVADTPAYRANFLLWWFKGAIRSSNLASCKTTGHYTSSTIPVLSAITNFWCRSNVFTSGFWKKLKTTETENMSYLSVCSGLFGLCWYMHKHTPMHIHKGRLQV